MGYAQVLGMVVLAVSLLAGCGSGTGSGNTPAGKKSSWASSQTSEIMTKCMGAIQNTNAPKASHTPTCSCWLDRLTTAFTPQEANLESNLDAEYNMLKECAMQSGWTGVQSQIAMPGFSSIVRSIQQEPAPKGPLGVLEKLQQKNPPAGAGGHGAPDPKIVPRPLPGPIVIPGVERPPVDVTTPKTVELKESLNVDLEKLGLLDTRATGRNESVDRILPLPGGAFAVIVKSSLFSRNKGPARVLVFSREGRLVRDVSLGAPYLREARISPDGLLVTETGENALDAMTTRIFDLAATPPAELRSYADTKAKALGFSADGKSLVIGRAGTVPIGKWTNPVSGKTFNTYGTTIELKDTKTGELRGRSEEIADEGVSTITQLPGGGIVVPSKSSIHFLSPRPDGKIDKESTAFKSHDNKGFLFTRESPVVATKDGVLLHATTQSDDGTKTEASTLFKLDPVTKKALWSHEVPGKNVLWEGVLFKNGDVLVRVQDRRDPTGAEKETVRILDGRTGAVKFETAPVRRSSDASFASSDGNLISTPAHAFDRDGRPVRFARPATITRAEDAVELPGGQLGLRRYNGVRIVTPQAR